jgi:small subunit ribosomal protein S1
LEIDKSNRRLSLGHKQLEENPWDVLETMFVVDSIHDGIIVEMMDKGAVISLPYGVEGFATPKHLVKEDGAQALVDEKLAFKVIEFNKDAKRIIVSHSRVHEDVKRAAKAEANGEKVDISTPVAAPAAKKSAPKKAKAESAPVAASTSEKTTLGDIQSLADLKDQLVEAAAKTAAKAAKKAKAEAAPAVEEVVVAPVAEVAPVVEAEVAPVVEAPVVEAPAAEEAEEAPKA